MIENSSKMSHFSFCLRFCNMRLFWEVFKHCELMFLFGISYLLLPKSRHLLASISSFKSIASTLSNPITTMKPICGSGIGKKGKIFKVKAAETRRQRRITSNQMSKNEIGWELRHFADGCLQEGGTRDSKEGRRKLLATDQSLCFAADTPSSQLFLLTILF